MKDIIIDEEFKHLMPALDAKTRESLESNLLENGCRDALVIWGNILIDGHNRYELCTKHGIPFETISKDFASREDVLLWIIRTQVSRRNLSPIQLSHFRGLHYRTEKKLASNENGVNQYNVVATQNGEQPHRKLTASRLAEQYRISPNTITRDAKASEAIDNIGELSPEAKRLILSGEVKVEKKTLEQLTSASKEELFEIIKEIENGTYEKIKLDARRQSSATTSEKPLKEKLPNKPKAIEKFTVSKITSEIYDALIHTTKTGDPKEIKNALKVYIDTLIDLYKLL